MYRPCSSRWFRVSTRGPGPGLRRAGSWLADRQTDRQGRRKRAVGSNGGINCFGLHGLGKPVTATLRQGRDDLTTLLLATALLSHSPLCVCASSSCASQNPGNSNTLPTPPEKAWTPRQTPRAIGPGKLLWSLGVCDSSSRITCGIVLVPCGTPIVRLTMMMIATNGQVLVTDLVFQMKTPTAPQSTKNCLSSCERTARNSLSRLKPISSERDPCESQSLACCRSATARGTRADSDVVCVARVFILCPFRGFTPVHGT
jgi:hypothetical protein